nr:MULTISPECIES: 3'-5' exonuclease [unclassified Fibrobacter]
MAESPDAEGKKVLDWLAELKKDGKEYSDICIAAYSNNSLRRIKDLLHKQNIASYDRTSGSAKGDAKGVNLCTFHSIKGLEFKSVILMGVNEQNVPSKVVPNAYPFTDKDAVQQKDYLLQMRSLLYVAITRARETTFITGTGEQCGLLK